MTGIPLPNLIIAGVPKAGTSSVHHWLTAHPDVGGASQKETYYFVDEGTHTFDERSNFNRQGMDGYRKFFTHLQADNLKYIVESTPAYIYHHTALNQLPNIETQPKFIFILREPSAQIYSSFQYFSNNWNYLPGNIDFEAFIELAKQRSQILANNELLQHAIDNCRYINHLERWLSACGPERIKVYLFDDLIQDNKAFMKQMAIDLGLNADFYDTYDYPVENETYQVRSRSLQALNIRIRALLPQGAAYRALRSIYRRINTRPGSAKKTTHDQHLMADLRALFEEDNRRLSETFNLDIASWTGTQ